MKIWKQAWFFHSRVGTSTDVSRFADDYEHVFETTTAGVTIQAPQVRRAVDNLWGKGVSGPLPPQGFSNLTSEALQQLK